MSAPTEDVVYQLDTTITDPNSKDAVQVPDAAEIHLPAHDVINGKTVEEVFAAPAKPADKPSDKK